MYGILSLHMSLQGKSALWSHLLHYQAREEKLLEQQQQADVLPGTVCMHTSTNTRKVKLYFICIFFL